MLNAELHPQAQTDQWLHERHRFDVLAHICRRVRADCSVAFTCGGLPEVLGFSREETFRIIHDLEYRGLLSYVGSGPLVRLTPVAITYLITESGRRRSIRDPESPS